MDSDLTTKGQFITAVQRSSDFCVQAAAVVMEEIGAAKQDKLIGTAGQVVGFDENGQAVAQGTQGLVGPQGPKGDTGATGAKGDKGDQGLFYGTCSTYGSTAAKTASVTGFTLVTGAAAAVKFTYANYAENPTLNINAAGAKAIRTNGSAAAGYGAWADGEVVQFVYDGTNFIMTNGKQPTGPKLSATVQIQASEGAPVDMELPEALKGKTVLMEFINSQGSYYGDAVQSQVYGVAYDTGEPPVGYFCGSMPFCRYLDTIQWLGGEVPSNVTHVRFTQM